MRDGTRTDELYDFDYEFYDILFEDFTDDLEFIKSLARETGGPILELMSGTGRVLLPLAREGYEVWGLDVNEKMTSKLESKLAKEPKEVQGRVHLVRGDVRGFHLDRKFRLIFVTLNSFLHLITPGDQEACLTTVREHLEPSGRFFNAFFNPDLNRPEGVLKLNKVAKVENGEIMWLESQTFDLPSQSTTVYFIYDLLGPEGDVKRRLGKTTLRLMFRREMEHLLNRCGLEAIRIMGGYDGRPFEKDSPMQVYLCRRADAKV
jgi:SAM-dependent methyltransferase